MLKRLVIGGIGFCLIYLLAACADQSKVAHSPATADSGANLPIGSYRETLLIAPASRVLLGYNFDYEVWTLELSESGKFTLTYFGTPWFEGKYNLDINNELVFSSSQGLQDCSDPDHYEPLNEGIYSWSYDGQFLILNEIEDSCNLRKQVLNSHPLLTLPPGQ